MADTDTSDHMLEASAENDPFNGAPSFSLQHRLYRLAWKTAWFFLARWTPPQLHRWRIFLANSFGARIDATAAIYPSVDIWYPANLSMGRRATLGPKVNCYSMAPITIGEDTVISQGAFLCTGTHDIHHRAFQIMARPINIGARCWICADGFVGPGVDVGDGAVLAARGATFQNLTEWKVYLGNPASLKGERKRQ